MVLFTAAVLFHGFDHARRGADAAPRDVLVAGVSAVFLEVGVVALVAARHRWAPDAAVAAGFGLAAGYLLVHFLPGRGWLSDPLSAGAASGVTAVSWLAASLEVAAALALGAAGLAARGAEAPAVRSWVQPVVLAMVLGNAALLAVTGAQLA